MSEDLRMSRVEWALLLVLSVLWGGSFFFSKVAVRELPPLTIVFLRFSVASAILLALLRATGQVVPTRRAVWAAFAGMGLLNNLVPAGLIVWGQTMIPSALASVLIATTPIFSIVATRSIGVGEKLSAGKVVGMALGIGGVIVLFGLSGFDVVRPSAIGIAACLGAAVSYGFANALGSRFRRLGIAPVTGAFGQMAATSVMSLPAVLVFDTPWRMAFPGADVIACMVGLALLSTALGYVIFFRILATAGSTNVSLVTLLIPVSAVLLGSVVLGESLSRTQIVGMVLIGVGLIAIDGRAWRATSRPPTGSSAIG